MTPHGGAYVSGTGSNLPDKILTNAELAETLDTSDEWIRERTGIEQRHIGGSTATMATHAGRNALDAAGLTGADIDLVIVATTSAEQMMPGAAAVVHAELEIRGGAHDLNAACSGFVYGLIEANSMIMGGLDHVLVIGSDALSPWTDWTDRSTAILFGDGAGAVVMSACDKPSLLGWDIGADGTTRHILYTDHNDTIKMDGREVFRKAVRAVVGSAHTAMDRAGVAPDEITWLIPHQANTRIVDSICEKLEIDVDRAVMVIADTGNTSAGSVPLALHAGVDDGRIKPGDLLLLSGFGSGMSWASAVLRWQP
jgi:3-oxoacyl-[acyl-carrier-protein] synthase-3